MVSLEGGPSPPSLPPRPPGPPPPPSRGLEDRGLDTGARDGPGGPGGVARPRRGRRPRTLGPGPRRAPRPRVQGRSPHRRPAAGRRASPGVRGTPEVRGVTPGRTDPAREAAPRQPLPPSPWPSPGPSADASRGPRPRRARAREPRRADDAAPRGPGRGAPGRPNTQGLGRETPHSREPRPSVVSAMGRSTRRHAENARPPPVGDTGERRGVVAPLSCANGAKAWGPTRPGAVVPREARGHAPGAPAHGAKPPGSGGRGQRPRARTRGPRGRGVPPAVTAEGTPPPGARASDGARAPPQPIEPRGDVAPGAGTRGPDAPVPSDRHGPGGREGAAWAGETPPGRRLRGLRGLRVLKDPWDPRTRRRRPVRVPHAGLRVRR